MPDYGTPKDLGITVRTGSGHEYVLSTEEQQGSFSTQLPGGPATCTFQVYGTVPYVDTLLPLGSHVELADLAGVFWSGLVTRSGVNSPYSSGMVQLTASGYSVTAGFLRNDDPGRYIHYHTVGGLFLEAQRHLPVISGSTTYIDVAALAVELEADAPDFLGATALDVWNQAMSLADVYWLVVPDPAGVDPYPVLVAGVRGSGRQLTVALADGAVDQVGWNLSDIENEVLVAWVDADGVTHIVNSANTSDVKYGLTGEDLTIQKYLNTGGDLGAESDAVILATRAVTRFGSTRITSSTIPIPWGVGVLDGSLNDVPLWRVASGDLIQVFEASTNGYPSSEPRLITGTSFDLRTFALSVTTGERHGELASQRRRSAERSVHVPANLPGVSDRFGPPLAPKVEAPKPVNYEPGSNSESKRPAPTDQNVYLDLHFNPQFVVPDPGDGSEIAPGFEMGFTVSFPFRTVAYRITGNPSGSCTWELTKNGSPWLTVSLSGTDTGELAQSESAEAGAEIVGTLTACTGFKRNTLALHCVRTDS